MTFVFTVNGKYSTSSVCHGRLCAEMNIRLVFVVNVFFFPYFSAEFI